MLNFGGVSAFLRQGNHWTRWLDHQWPQRWRQECCPPRIDKNQWSIGWECKHKYIYIGMFPKNRDTPKWLVYDGKPYENWWFGGIPIFGNSHICIYIYLCNIYLHTSAMLLKTAPCRQVTVYEMPIGSPSTLVALKKGSFKLQRTLSMTALGTPSPSFKKKVLRTAGYTNMPRYGYHVLLFCSFLLLWYHTTGFLHLRLDEFLFKWFSAPYRHPETHLAIIKSNHGLWESCSFQVPFSACMNQLRYKS